MFARPAVLVAMALSSLVAGKADANYLMGTSYWHGAKTGSGNLTPAMICCWAGIVGALLAGW